MKTRATAESDHYLVPYPVVGTTFDDKEIAVVRDVVLSGETLSQGAFRLRFEEAFREHVGTRHAVSVTSGTVALELAIHLLDLSPGDEVITTPQTYQATIQPLLDRKVRVRFADIDPRTANIDPDRVEAMVTPRTRAIILVHYGGLPADMDRLMAVAARHDLLVVEDAAHALGGRHRGRVPGGIGHIGCFSFHSSKNISTLGEGGMITLDLDDWATRLRRLRDNQADMVLADRTRTFGVSTGPPPGALYPGQAYTHECLGVRRAGTNATLSEVASAVGLVQLDKLADQVRRRRAIADRLSAELLEFDEVRPQLVPPDVEHPYHLFTFFVDAERIDRDELLRVLAAQGVQTYLRYCPLPLMPEWQAQGHQLGDCPVAERLWFSEHVNLPCHPGLSDSQVEVLAGALNHALTKSRRD